MLKPIMTFILQYYYRFFFFGEERGPCQAPNIEDDLIIVLTMMGKNTALYTVKHVFSADTLFSRLGDFAVSRILIFADAGTEHST